MKAKVGFGPLERIYISHLHGDHVTGIPGLLMTLNLSCREKPLTIYGPPGLQRYVQGILDTLALHPDYELNVRETEGGVIHENDHNGIQAVRADHNVFTLAYALVEGQRPGLFDVSKAKELGIPEGPLYRDLQNGKDIQLKDGRTIHSSEIVGPPRPGRKVVYAVDTRPCPAVVELARSADLLIHDGMFTDELAREAKERGHSTTRQAAEIAKEAGVGQLILTHISSRYEDDGALLSEAQAVFLNTAVAQDLMAVELSVHK